MLTLIIRGDEYFDETTNEFLTVGDRKLVLEHSLASVSKWEAIYNRAFLSPAPKSAEEHFAYLQCMVLAPEDSHELLNKLTREQLEQITEYMSSRQSGTWFPSEPASQGGTESITAELIYHWMFEFNIPLELQNWHLTRLMTLIRVCSMKRGGNKKLPRNTAAQRRELNAARRAQYNTTG